MKKRLVVPVEFELTRHDDHFDLGGIRRIGKPVEMYEADGPSSSTSSVGYNPLYTSKWDQVFGRDKPDLPN